MTRSPVTVALSGRARRLDRELTRWERRWDEADTALSLAAAEWERLLADTRARFGCKVPGDPLLLDVLASVEVEEGDVWRWKGARNNKGFAVVKIARQELSLVRYLAIAFGVIQADDHGLLYPTGDPDDVNPAHRVLRRSDSPVGNFHRWKLANEANGARP